MQALSTVLLVVMILSALTMVGLILVQHGKGADMGAAFGSGSSGSLFGATGSANFLSRTTAVLAAVFFACTLLLAYFGNARPAGGSGSVLERVGIPAPATAPAAPAAPAASGPAGQIPGAAGQIPGASGSSVPAPQSAATTPATAAPQAPASGAAQIPGQ